MASCPHCGYETGPADEECPLCGTELGAAPPEGAGVGDSEAGGVPPWEDPAVGFPGDLLETWRASLFEPSRFFADVPWAGPLARPVLYYLVVTVVGAFFTLWWEAIGLLPTLPSGASGGWEGMAGGAGALLGFFLAPFLALLGLALWGLVLHLMVLLLCDGRRSLGATLRVVCYASGPAVFSAVPLLGGLVGSVWSLVLQVVGLRAAHRTTTGRAVAAVLVPLLALAAFFVLMLVLAFAFIGLWAGGA